MFVSGRWGFITKTGGLVINARSETVATNGLFKWSYQQRRALMPIDGFFEWKDIYSTGKDKQPYAIAMESGEPFALAAIWEEMWHDPKTERENPHLLRPHLRAERDDGNHPQPHAGYSGSRRDYSRWLMDEDPRHLLKPFPAELMTMWTINRKVGSPKNDTAGSNLSTARSRFGLICSNDPAMRRKSKL